MDQTTQYILKADRVDKRVRAPGGELTILDQVSLQILTAEKVAICGKSGSGKTTLLGILAGLDLPSQGEVWLAGQSLKELDEDGRAALRNQRVGFVFQSFHLIPSLTALENTMLPLELAGKPDARDRARDILQQVGLDLREGHYPKQLSGGEQQRVAIARAFAAKPSILFADEPTGNLDLATGELICDLLFQLNEKNQTTLVLVTHDAMLADRCDRSLQMTAGQIHE